MASGENLLLIGDLFRSTIGADESWAILYFDKETCDLVVSQSSDTTSMYPRYLPNKPSPDIRTTLREFVEKQAGYREKAIRLIVEKLGH